MKQRWFIGIVWLGFLGCFAACGARSSLHGDDEPLAGQGGHAPGSSGNGGAGGGQSVDPSKIISLSDQSVIESEAHVATASNGFVAVAWISIPEMEPGAIGYAFSVNNGDSFVPPAFVKSPDDRTASDPVLAVDQQKNFYLTWVGFYRDSNGEPFDMRIYVAKANAGTTVFGAPILVSDPNEGSFADKPWITVTPKGAILATYGRESSKGWGIVAARSEDGVNWKRSVIVEDSIQSKVFRNLSFPCVANDSGAVYAVYARLGSDTSIRMHRSDDDGVSFPTSTELVVNAANEQVGYDGPSCVARGSDIWVSYGLSNTPGGAENSAVLYSVKIARSNDFGKSISQWSDAHDKDAAVFYLHPQLALADDNTLHLGYYAGDFDQDPEGSMRRSLSLDAGQSFSASEAIGTPITFLPDRGDFRWLGDYMGFAFRAGSLYTAYTDNASGVAHIAFKRIDLP